MRKCRIIGLALFILASSLLSPSGFSKEKPDPIREPELGARVIQGFLTGLANATSTGTTIDSSRGQVADANALNRDAELLFNSLKPYPLRLAQAKIDYFYDAYVVITREPSHKSPKAQKPDLSYFADLMQAELVSLELNHPTLAYQVNQVLEGAPSLSITNEYYRTACFVLEKEGRSCSLKATHLPSTSYTAFNTDFLKAHYYTHALKKYMGGYQLTISSIFPADVQALASPLNVILWHGLCLVLVFTILRMILGLTGQLWVFLFGGSVLQKGAVQNASPSKSKFHHVM